MMMGFGSYGNGGGSSSSSSNLSALAPPFTVDRSVSKPLVDLTEPPLNWLNTHSLSFDSMHSSNAYGYPFNPPSAVHMPSPENSISVPSTDSFLYGQSSDAIPAATNLVEAKPYYPSYVSPSKFTYDDYTQSLSGLWDGSSCWEYGKKVEFGDSFEHYGKKVEFGDSSCSKEMNVPDLPYKDYANQGAQSTKGLSTCEQNSNSIDMLGGQKHLGSASRVQKDYKSYSGKIYEFTPAEFAIKPVLEQGCSGNHQTSYGTLYEKRVKLHGISSNDISSSMKASPGFGFRSQAVGSGPSAPNTSLFNNVENGGVANNMGFSSNDNFSKTNDFHPLQSSEGKVHFDSSQLSFHLEEDNHRFPDIGPAGFKLTRANNGAANHFEGSSECFDHFNPAVDSPCWRGVPMYQLSPLEISGPSSKVIKKMEAGNDSNSIDPADNAIKFSPKQQSEYSVYQENGSPETDSASSPKTPSLANLLFGEHGFDHVVKAGSHHTKSTCGLGVQFSDYTDKPNKDYIVANNAVDEFNLKPFESMQQNSVEDELAFEKKCEFVTAVADVGNDASEGCSSHVPFHATEHVLSSTPLEAAPSKLTKLHGEELVPKICAQTLISTMNNLSELILFHCSNEVCELKENDFEALKNVANNLYKCISKALRPEAPSQESSLPEKYAQFLRGLPELREGVTVSSPHQVTKAAVSVLNQIPSDYQHIKEESIHDIMSSKKDEKHSDFTSQGDDADRVKDDNMSYMTQAIKKVLSENFAEDKDAQPQVLLYKNLWLEAEAALCSVNYKARFDRMKVELERCKSSTAKDLSEGTTELERSSQTTCSLDLNMANKLPHEVKDDSTRDISTSNFPIINTSCHPADVLARFNILKCQESNANCSSTDVEKLLSSHISSEINKVDKMESEAKNDQTPYISTCGSPKSSSTGHADDVEASVIARFRILKSRIENSIHTSTEDRLSPHAADLGFAGEGKHWADEDGVLDVNMEPVLRHDSGNCTRDKLTVNEFHIRIKDDAMIETHRTNRLGNQPPASCYDSSSSDWEHVLKEDLPAQNC